MSGLGIASKTGAHVFRERDSASRRQAQHPEGPPLPCLTFDNGIFRIDTKINFTNQGKRTSTTNHRMATNIAHHDLFWCLSVQCSRHYW